MKLSKNFTHKFPVNRSNKNDTLRSRYPSLISELLEFQKQFADIQTACSVSDATKIWSRFLNRISGG